MLWLAAILAALSEVQSAEQGRGRLHQLRGRLGLQPEPERPSTLRRLQHVERQYGRVVLAKVVSLLTTESIFPAPGETSRYDRMIPWLAREVSEARIYGYTTNFWLLVWSNRRARIFFRQAMGLPVLSDVDRQLLEMTDDAQTDVLVYPSDLPVAPGAYPRASVEAWRRGEMSILTVETHRAYTVDDAARRLGSLLDWVEDQSPDLLSMTFEQALSGSQAWHAQFKASAAYRQPVANGVVVARWDDGATLQRLVTPKQLEEEGASMGHCVGGYWADARDEGHRIFSYRDGDRVPHATLDTPMGRDVSPYIEDVEGVDDGPISDEKAVKRMTWFMDYLGLGTGEWAHKLTGRPTIRAASVLGLPVPGDREQQVIQELIAKGVSPEKALKSDEIAYLRWCDQIAMLSGAIQESYAIAGRLGTMRESLRWGHPLSEEESTFWADLQDQNGWEEGEFTLEQAAGFYEDPDVNWSELSQLLDELPDLPVMDLDHRGEPSRWSHGNNSSYREWDLRSHDVDIGYVVVEVEDDGRLRWLADDSGANRFKGTHGETPLEALYKAHMIELPKSAGSESTSAPTWIAPDKVFALRSPLEVLRWAKAEGLPMDADMERTMRRLAK